MIKMNCLFETSYHKIFQKKLTGSIQKIVLNLTYQAHFENNAKVVTLIYSFLILEKQLCTNLKGRMIVFVQTYSEVPFFLYAVLLIIVHCA